MNSANGCRNPALQLLAGAENPDFDKFLGAVETVDRVRVTISFTFPWNFPKSANSAAFGNGVEAAFGKISRRCFVFSSPSWPSTCSP